MRIIQMDPQEKRLVPVSCKPRECLIDYLIGRPLHKIEICLRKAAEIKMIVIEIETVIQPETAIQYCSSDHGTSVVPAGPQNSRKRRLFWVQVIAAEIVHTVHHRVSARQNNAMRGQGDWNGRVGLVKTY